MEELAKMKERVDSSMAQITQGISRINEGMQKIQELELEQRKTIEMLADSSPTKTEKSKSIGGSGARNIPMDQWNTEFSIIRDGLMSHISFTTEEIIKMSQKVEALERKVK